MIGQSNQQLKKIAPKFPSLLLGLVGVVGLYLTMTPLIAESRKRKIYDFNRQEIVFYLASPVLFENRSREKSDELMVSLFPKEIQKKVKKVIRPVLILCEKYKLDPFWVLSLMWAESTFRPEVVSNKGARGLMQVMPPTFEITLSEMERRGIQLEANKEASLLRVDYGHFIDEIGVHKFTSKLKNIEVGIFYLKMLFDDFENNHSYATVSYNMGPYWTKTRLKNNAPVAVKNKYLNKILKNYFYLTKNLQSNPNVTYTSSN